jgi:uncharacterized damage-inducible protein DinB
MASATTTDLTTQVLDSWNIHARIVLYLLDAVQEEHLTDSATKKGRTVGVHFAHIHNVRLMWLKASAPELLEGLTKLEGDAITKGQLAEALQQSADAVQTLLETSVQAGRVKSFKPHLPAFIGYLISHEGFHMGKIDLILSLAGHAVPDKAHYGMWEWGVR